MTEQLPPRLPNEPEAAYQRFLSYCKLGMGRSVRAAYAAYREELEGSHEGQQDTKRPRPPGQWQRQSVRFHWRERASEERPPFTLLDFLPKPNPRTSTN